MDKTFRAFDPGQDLLLPPSLDPAGQQADVGGAGRLHALAAAGADAVGAHHAGARLTVPCISGAGGATATTALKIEFRDWAGTLITTPNTVMKAFVTHGGGRYAVDPATIDTTAFPFSNIWLFGVMKR